MSDHFAALPHHVQVEIRQLAQKWRPSVQRNYPQGTPDLVDAEITRIAEAWSAKLSIYNWSVEAIEAALQARDSDLADDIVVVRCDYDFMHSIPLVLVWSMRDVSAVMNAVRLAAPDRQSIVYSTISDALYLGISPEKWNPIWARSTLRDHVVLVHDESEYIYKAVAQARQQHRELQNAYDLLDELRETVAHPLSAEMVADLFALMAYDAEQLVEHYGALPAGTLLSTSEIAIARFAVVARDLFSFARDAIAQYREKWEEAGAFGHLVALVIEKLLILMPIYTAYVAKDHRGEAGLGATISTAGVILANLASNGRLDRSLRAASSGMSDTQTKHELLLAATALVVADMPDPIPGRKPAEYIDFLVKGVERILEGEQLELDKQTTILDPTTDKRIAARKSYSLEREITSASESDEGDETLQNDRLGLFPPHEEVIARQSVMENLNRDRELWIAAKLSAREFEIMHLAKLGYQPKEIAERLSKTANEISVLKSRAGGKIARVLEQRKATG